MPDGPQRSITRSQARSKKSVQHIQVASNDLLMRPLTTHNLHYRKAKDHRAPNILPRK